MDTKCPYCDGENWEAQEYSYADGEEIIVECEHCHWDYRVTVTFEVMFLASKIDEEDE